MVALESTIVLFNKKSCKYPECLAEARVIYEICNSCLTNANLYAIFIRNTFINKARLKLAKNQTNAKQHPEAEIVLFKNYSYSSCTLSSKKIRTYSKT